MMNELDFWKTAKLNTVAVNDIKSLIGGDYCIALYNNFMLLHYKNKKSVDMWTLWKFESALSKKCKHILTTYNEHEALDKLKQVKQ